MKLHGAAPGVFLVRLKSAGTYVISMCNAKSKSVHHILTTNGDGIFALKGTALGTRTLVSEVVKHLSVPQKEIKWASFLLVLCRL